MFHRRKEIAYKTKVEEEKKLKRITKEALQNRKIYDDKDFLFKRITEEQEKCNHFVIRNQKYVMTLQELRNNSWCSFDE